ncbi:MULTISPECIES: GGDEF domain-containing protein [Rhizobium]|uniref:diguanylate cyclase n=1 Tax=Rhizobium tropici TaxID=398 RepID=A0A6P1CF41_RHITR|nr:MULTISPECIES: diguanylate cyclase [Rhizobium]AGB75367.1 GGDEF domain-containing protein [Rhizobium tropici CIAT 899]MBB4241744.1 diguanylate cyclase (GGDEF)-like protein [Rhizobium tropici]MBB5593609.1 diguanylate cyclase (GGDEF)-like protein [Rhizobium tropici]MBB6492069.1 diguanylate cyclase (GGDEF)-like protein [Rhizobium tropici]NEV13434.1 GGDEF domain-containing protein [Rhizobium tropici]
MTNELDLPTVLFLQKTSYIAGALTLGYLRLTSAESRGVGLLAASFIVLAAGSTLAGYAELYPALYGLLSLVNIVLAVLGYCLLASAFVLISDPDRKINPWLVFLPAIGTLAAGLITAFHLTNTYRATTFTVLGCLTMAATAVVVFRDAFREPLPIRRLIVGLLAAASLLSLVMALEFSTRSFPVLDVANGFLLMIISKFVLAIAIVIFISERQHAKIKNLADRDHLTGLYNRRFFNANAPSQPHPGDAVLFLDIDHFKQLNDRWGHAAGDEVLSTMAQAVQSTLPKGALLARQGGEEFIVFLPAKAGDALFYAERIRKTVAELRFPTLGPEITVTISGGVARAFHGTELASLCREADRALYLAKAAGRNRICDADLDAVPQSRLRLA